MSTAIDKAKISGITALFGAIVAIIYGFANFAMFTSLVTFITMMMVQYGSIKVKILVPAALLLTLFAGIQYIGGVHP